MENIEFINHVDESNFTKFGEMNIVVQVWHHKEDGILTGDIYHPRKNSVWTGEIEREDIKNTIERMKIAITKLQMVLDGDIDHFYYWENK